MTQSLSGGLALLGHDRASLGGLAEARFLRHLAHFFSAFFLSASSSWAFTSVLSLSSRMAW